MDITQLASLVAFFSQPAQAQMAMLPVLDLQKYDFPDGDLITDDPLEVLLKRSTRPRARF
jgi:hypothetical protein